MATISTNEFRAGVKVMLDNDPCSILENEFVKPGKGRAVNRVKLRNLRTGRVLEKTFTSGDSLPAADVTDREMQYLYNDGEFWYFMDPETFDQYSTNETVVADAKQWVKEQDLCQVTLYNGAPLTIAPPNFVELRVVETEPGIRGDTATGGTKTAVLETGAVVRVPLFIEEGETLRVDTRTGAYIARVRESSK